MLQAVHIVDVLDRIARRFETQIEDVPGCTECKAWGQFLEMERRHHQIGLYGTASGLIVLQLADRSNSAAVRQALKTLQFWWDQRQNTEEQPGQWFLLTLRVAYLHMALSCIEDDSANLLRREVAQRLWDTQLPAGQWGHYWESIEEHDQTPQVLTTAVVIISFLICPEANSEARGRLKTATEWLESKVVSGIELAPLHRISAITALVAFCGEHMSKDVRKAARRIALRFDPELGDLGVSFCDFRYHSEDSLQWRRDYFIVPKAILLAVGGFLPNAPFFLRLRAERILDALVRKLKQCDFLYKPEPDRAAASKDNAWVALLLKLANQNRQTRGLLMRLGYCLLRKRGPSVFWDHVFPVISIISVAALNVAREDETSLFVRIWFAVGTSIVVCFCGPKLPNFFGGRDESV